MTTTDPSAPTIPRRLLTDEMLARFDERAPRYDRENRFFDEDFAELRDSGYLSSPCPTEFGGAGLGLDEYSQLVRRLAYDAPATALAVNMHVYWTGVAADLLRNGRRLVPLHPREGGRRRGLRRPPRRGRQRPARCCCRPPRPSGSTAAGRSAATRSSAASRRCGPTAGSTPWTRPTRPGPRIVHGFLPRDTPGVRDRRHLGHARHAGHPEPGHRPRPGVRARRAGGRRVPRRVRRRRAVPRVRLRLGAARASPPSTRRGPPGLRHHRRARCRRAPRSP